jgi:hypothetical protein
MIHPRKKILSFPFCFPSSVLVQTGAEPELNRSEPELQVQFKVQA